MQNQSGANNRVWASKLQELYSILEDNDTKLMTLRNIDRMMLQHEMTLESFVKEPLSELVRLTKASSGHFLIDTDHKYEIFTRITNNSLPDPITSLPDSITYDELENVLSHDQREPIFITSSNWKTIQLPTNSSKCFLILPFWLSSDRVLSSEDTWPSTEKRFGIFVLECTETLSELSPLKDPSLQDYALTIVTQLAIGWRLRFSIRHAEWFESMMSKFFEFQLTPSKCFNELARHVSRYIPDFGPLKVTSSVETQIILLGEKGLFLTIVGGTTGPVGTKLKVEQSVVGLVFEDLNIPFVVGNPQTDHILNSRYKSYIGKEKDVLIQSELVLPISNSDGMRIAAINVESEFENLFKQAHIDALSYICATVAPIVSALRDRIIERNRQQNAIAFAQHSYWDSVGELLRHDVSSPILAIRLSVDNAISAIDNQKANIEEIASNLTGIFDSIHLLNTNVDIFSKDIWRTTVFTSTSAQSLIDDAIAKISQKARLKNIIIEFIPDQDFDVYSSSMLTMHIYNMIDNSIYWIERRKSLDTEQVGYIKLSLESGPMPSDDQERDLNLSCEIRIEDNGLGCPPQELQKLLDKPVDSRRTGEKGMGWALYAANNYVNLLGGNMNVDSVEGKGFAVILRLPLFDQNIHGETLFTV